MHTSCCDDVHASSHGKRTGLCCMYNNAQCNAEQCATCLDTENYHKQNLAPSTTDLTMIFSCVMPSVTRASQHPGTDRPRNLLRPLEFLAKDSRACLEPIFLATA